MRILYAPLGTKAKCKNCNTHIFTFLKDTYIDDKIYISDVCFEKGQEPLDINEKMICKRCNKNYEPGLINLEKPENDRIVK